jgi:hypothetical protein
MKTKISSIDCTNTKFIISSHISSYKITLPKLIKSLMRNNIREENIFVVVGGAEKEYIENQYYFVSHNSYDHTAIITIIEKNLKSDYWFVMHDTCELGPDFYKLLKQFKIKHNYTALTEMAWMNIGLFSNKFIKNNDNYILSLKNCSKERAILSERIYSRLDDYGWFGLQKDHQRIRECKNIYNDDKKRDVLYFPFLDFYKFQSYEALRVMIKK